MKTISQRRRSGVMRPRARRGAVIVLGTLLIVVLVLLTVLVVDWSYLVSVNRNMQHLCSVMALAAAPELLDPALLVDANGPPTPDPSGRRAAAISMADQYRQQNNTVTAPSQQLSAEEITVRTGFVADVTQKPCILDMSGTEQNTVFVGAIRTATGSHPVRYPVDIWGTVAAAEIRGGAFATLDNLLVGFQPENGISAPVMPLGIQTAAWASQRTGDSNGNGILEMNLLLNAASPTGDANAGLLFYRGTGGQQAIADQLPPQIGGGLTAADLPPTGRLGPATPTSRLPVTAMQQADENDAGTAPLLAALTAQVGQRRVFPLFQEVTDVNPDGVGTAQVEGFVACTILGAEIAAHRLTVRVEPCYLIHHTAWTAPPGDPTGPQRNLYLYRLRLSR